MKFERFCELCEDAVMSTTPATPTKFDPYKQKQGYEDATPEPYARSKQGNPAHGYTSKLLMLSLNFLFSFAWG